MNSYFNEDYFYATTIEFKDHRDLTNVLDCRYKRKLLRFFTSKDRSHWLECHPEGAALEFHNQREVETLQEGILWNTCSLGSSIYSETPAHLICDGFNHSFRQDQFIVYLRLRDQLGDREEHFIRLMESKESKDESSEFERHLLEMLKRAKQETGHHDLIFQFEPQKIHLWEWNGINKNKEVSIPFNQFGACLAQMLSSMRQALEQPGGELTQHRMDIWIEDMTYRLMHLKEKQEHASQGVFDIMSDSHLSQELFAWDMSNGEKQKFMHSNLVYYSIAQPSFFNLNSLPILERLSLFCEEASDRLKQDYRASFELAFYTFISGKSEDELQFLMPKMSNGLIDRIKTIHFKEKFKSHEASFASEASKRDSLKKVFDGGISIKNLKVEIFNNNNKRVKNKSKFRI